MIDEINNPTNLKEDHRKSSHQERMAELFSFDEIMIQFSVCSLWGLTFICGELFFGSGRLLTPILLIPLGMVLFYAVSNIYLILDSWYKEKAERRLEYSLTVQNIEQSDSLKRLEQEYYSALQSEQSDSYRMPCLRAMSPERVSVQEGVSARTRELAMAYAKAMQKQVVDL